MTTHIELTFSTTESVRDHILKAIDDLMRRLEPSEHQAGSSRVHKYEVDGEPRRFR